MSKESEHMSKQNIHSQFANSCDPQGIRIFPTPAEIEVVAKEMFIERLMREYCMSKERLAVMWNQETHPDTKDWWLAYARKWHFGLKD